MKSTGKFPVNQDQKQGKPKIQPGKKKQPVEKRQQPGTALQDSEEKFRRLFETAQDGILLLDAETGVITDANPFIEKMLGYSRDEIVGKKLWEIGPFKDELDSQAAFQKLQKKKYIRYEDLPLETKDGQHRNVEFVSNVYRVGSQKVIQCNIRDITEHKQIQEALKTTQSLLVNIMENAPMSVDVVTADDRFRLVNRAWEVSHHLTREQAVGNRLGNLFPAKLAQRFYLDTRRVLESKESISFEESVDDPDDPRHYYTIKFPLFDSAGSVEAVGGISIDITERKRAEDALREEHDKLAATLQAIPDLMFEVDLDGCIYDYHAPQKEMLYAAPDAFLGKTVYDVLPESAAGIILDAIAQADQQGWSQGFVYSLDLPGGKRWFELSIAAKRNEKAAPRFVALARDITERILAEADLRESEERFHSLFENTTIGLYRTTPDGRILLANPTLVDLLGYKTFDELTQRNLEEDFEPEYPRSEFRQRIESDGAVKGFESAWKRTDGATIYVRENAKVIHDKDGKVLYYEGTVEDITERKRAEESLASERSLMESLLNNSTDSIYFKDTQSRFMRINRAMANKFGLDTPDQAVGKTDFDFYAQEHAQAAYADEQELIRSGHSIVIPERKELRLNYPPTWVSTIKMPVRDTEGNIVGIFGVSRDITEHKQVEEALGHSKEVLQAILDGIPVMIALFDPQGRFQLVNRCWQSTHGWSLKEVQSKDILAEIYPDPAYRKYVLDYIADAGSTWGDFKTRVRDGRVLDTLWANVPLADGSNIGIGIDITERKRVEDSLEREQYMWNTLMDNITDAVYFKDAQGRFTRVSKIMAAKRGLDDVGQLLGKTDFDFFMKDRAAEIYEQEQEITRTGQPVVNSEVLESWLDRSPTWVSVTKMPLRDQTGNVVGLFGISRDITGRKQAEESLRESEEKYRSLVERASDGITIIQDGVVKFANTRLVEMWGGTVEKVIETPFANYIHPDQLPAMVERYQRRMAGEDTPPMYETVLLRRDGSKVCVEINAGVIAYLGKPADLVTVRDITGRKQAEEIIQQNYDAQSALNVLLQLSMENIPLEDILKRALDLVLSIPWLALEVKGGIFLVGDEPDVLEMKAQSNLGEPIQRICARVPFGKCFCGRAASMQKLQFSNHLDEQHEISYEGMQPHGHYCVPILFAGRTIGVLNLYIREGHHQDQKEVEFLGAITNTMAGIIERKRAEEALARQTEELRQRNEELARLYRASGSLISGATLNLPELAQKIVEVLLREFGQANCSLILIQKETNELARLAIAGPYAGQVKFKNLVLDGPGLIPRAIRTNKVVNVGDVHSDPNYAKGWDAAQSELAIPLKVGGSVIGAIDVQSSEPNAFSPDDERLMTIFAERAALALEHGRLNAQTGLRMRQLSGLRTIDMAISGSFDINMILGVVLDQVIGQLDVHAADVFIFNAATQTFEFFGERGFRTPALQNLRIEHGHDYAWRVVQERQVINVPDIEAAPDGLQRSPDLTGEKFVAYVGIPLVAKGQIKGVLEVFHRERLNLEKESYDFLEMLAGQAAIGINNVELFEHLQGINAELIMAYDSTLEGWASALELRDKETEGHTRRVTDLTVRLAREMGVTENNIVHIYRGALLHDIGKMGVPDSIVLKPGPLTDDEWIIMRRHPLYAYDMLSPINYLRLALDIPYCHHEKWDGTGYPRGLEGKQIPLTARIFAVVDVWDALTSDRPYRKAWKEADALNYIKKQSGQHFDPAVAEAFLKESIKKG